MDTGQTGNERTRLEMMTEDWSSGDVARGGIAAADQG